MGDMQKTIDGLTEAIRLQSGDAQASFVHRRDVGTADSKSGACPYCGYVHIYAGICTSIKAIEYHPDGSIKRVELR